MLAGNTWIYDEQGREVTTTFVIWFSFFGQSGFMAYLPADKLEDEDPCWAMVESDCGELHDSFMVQLEEHWDQIKAFCSKWEIENTQSKDR